MKSMFDTFNKKKKLKRSIEIINKSNFHHKSKNKSYN